MEYLARQRALIASNPDVRWALTLDLLTSQGTALIHKRTYPLAYRKAVAKAVVRPTVSRVAVMNRIQLVDSETVAGGANYRQSELSNDLESWADHLLADSGYKVERLDVFDRATRKIHVRPDAAAYRGKVRYKVPSYVMAQRIVSKNHVHYDASGALLLVTRMTDGSRRGWIGHNACIFPTKRKVRTVAENTKRAEAKVVRQTIVGVGTRGPSVSAFDMSPRSLPRRYKYLPETTKALTAPIVNLLDDMAIGSTVILTADFSAVKETDSSFRGSNDMNYRPLELAQRTTIAYSTMADSETNDLPLVVE